MFILATCSHDLKRLIKNGFITEKEAVDAILSDSYAFTIRESCQKAPSANLSDVGTTNTCFKAPDDPRFAKRDFSSIDRCLSALTLHCDRPGVNVQFLVLEALSVIVEHLKTL